MQTTIKRIKTFIEASDVYLAKNHETTKLTYSIKKVIKNVVPLLEKFNGQLDDIKIDNAAVDERHNVLYLKNETSGQIIDYQYTKEGKKACNAAIRKLFAEDIVNIDVYICKDSTDLDKAFLPAFDGFVIEVPEEVEPK